MIWRVLARVVAAVHAVVEVAIFVSLFVAPLLWVTIALACVAVPMLLLRGRCWATDVERHLRRRGGDPRWKSPSMTRRLIYWFSLGTVSLRDTKRMQWWLFGAIGAVWAFRVFLL